MIAEAITGESTCEGLSSRWNIHPTLAVKLIILRQLLDTPLQIISGYRTAEEQAEAGVFAAPDHLSTHRTCPASGADLWVPAITVSKTVGGVVGSAVALLQVQLFGVAVGKVGLRWGGGSLRIAGIPTDWNHVDMGPRN